MIRRIVGIALASFGIVMGFLLLTYGGPILPHIGGPIIALVVGVALLVVRRKPRDSST